MIKPFGNNILIEPITESQIALSDTPSLCSYGNVLDVGEEVKKIKKGDKIGFTVWGLNHLDVEGKRYYFVPETPEFILGKI